MTDKALILLTISQPGGHVHRQRLPFDALPATIGRAPDNTLRLPHQTLSQHHLLLDVTDAHLLVLDNREQPPVPLARLPLASDGPADFTAGGLDFTIAIARDDAGIRKALESFAGVMSDGEGGGEPADVPSEDDPDAIDAHGQEQDGTPAGSSAHPHPENDSGDVGGAHTSGEAGSAELDSPDGVPDRGAAGRSERVAAVGVAVVAVAIVVAVAWWFFGA